MGLAGQTSLELTIEDRPTCMYSTFLERGNDFVTVCVSMPSICVSDFALTVF